MALATLSIDLVAQLAKLEQGLNKAVQLSEQSAAKIAGGMRVAAGGVAGLLGGAVVSTFAQQLRVAVDLADQMDDLGEKYGIAAGSLSEYRFAAEVAGTPTEALATGLQKLSKAASEGSDGLKLIGVSAKTADGSLKSADQLLLDVADKFATYEDGAAKAALAQDIFGKSGADLIPLLNRGSAGIKELRGEATALGAAFGDDVAKQAGEFNDQLAKLRLSTEGIKISVASYALPALNTLLSKLIEGIKVFGSFGAAVDRVFLKTNPFASAGQTLSEVTQEFDRNTKRIEKINGILAKGTQQDAVAKTYRDEAEGLAARNAELQKYSDYLKRSQAIDALKGSGGILDARDARAAAGNVRGAAPSLSDGKPGKEAKFKLTSAGVINAEFAGKLEASLAKDGALSPGNLTSVEDALKSVNSDLERTFELLNQTPSFKLEETRKDMQRLAAAFEQGLITAEQFTEAAQTRLGTLPQEVKPVVDDMQEYLKQFQRNVQDILGDGVESILQGNFDNIGKSFGDLLRKMAAQAIAADLGNQLFGKIGADGNRAGGGIFNNLLASLGSLFGFAKGGVFSSGVPVTAFANGGVVGSPTMFGMRGGLGLMGEAGPEAIMPLKRGRDGRLGVAGGGGQVVNNYNVSAGVTRNELMTALQLMQQQVEGRVFGQLRTRGLM